VTPEILIVGDEARRAALLDRIERLGYRVAFRAPYELDRRIREGPAPGAVVVCTADTDPAVLMARLRRSRRGSAVPVILFGTLGGDTRDLADVLDLGADQFVEDSADDDTMASALEELAGPPMREAPDDGGRIPSSSESDGGGPSGGESVESEASEGPRESMMGTDTGLHERRDSALGQLHRTLSMVESRLRSSETSPSPPYDTEVDDIDLATMGLDGVPDVDGDGGTLDPVESDVPLQTLDESLPVSPEEETDLPMANLRQARSGRPETTVRLDEAGIGGPSYVQHAVPAPVASEAALPSVGRRRRYAGPAMATEGSLAEIEVPRLLWRLHRARLTGVLSLSRGRVEKQVRFIDGEVVFANSNLSRDRLVDGLFRRGVITRSQYETARRLAAKEPRRAGQLLVEAGFVKPRELHGVLRGHLRRIIDSTFSWDEGNWSVERGPGCDEKILLEMPAAALIMEGVRHGMHTRQLWSLVGSGDLYPRLSRRSSLVAGGSRGLAEELRLSPSEERCLANLDGTHTLAELVEEGAVDEPELLTLVYALSVFELLELLGEPEATATPGHDPVELDRERVRDRLRLARQADYFALLGVGRDATRIDIVRAYEDLAETFGEDNLEEAAANELAEEMRELRAALAQARDILADDAMRSAYLAHLEDP
jgi:CheY-like chemotaxis protein